VLSERLVDGRHGADSGGGHGAVRDGRHGGSAQRRGRGGP
jgi:hypothetical protein